MAPITTLLLSIFAASVSASIQNPSMSPAPPMGFNNWARFMCNLNETLFVKTADAMVSKGLLAAGYNHINLDDCWMLHNRSSKGELQWDPTLFPHGLPWLADYVHAKGFKLGIYENAGNMTCGGYPGSQDHEEQDAATFESWGIDYLKLDGCNMDLQNGRSYYEEFKYRYSKWHSILSTLKRPMTFSESAPAYFSPNFHLDANNTDWYRTMAWVRQTGELARHSDDIKVYSTLPNGTFESGGHWDSMMNNYGMQVRLARYQKCGFYNDPDFLIPDWLDLSLDEKRTHFALWAGFSAPLIISAYIPDLTDSEIEYLTNKDIIAVDQDALCEQATLVSQDGHFDVLTKNLANGDRLVMVLNRGNQTNNTVIPLERLGLDSGERYKAKDLWSGSSTTIRRGVVEISHLKSHATAILRISGAGRKGEKLAVTPTGMIFNTFSLNCLAASPASHHRSPISFVTFAACNAADAQIWRTLSNGRILSLNDDGLCLAAKEEKVIVTACSHDVTEAKRQQWSYGINGNLVNKEKELCLQEAEKGAAVLTKCGIELDSQVFGLPGGVTVREEL
ncbi:hypothetical protein GQ43DRAFT_221660 [Delitschia confertaspora ATCC 74209]|uniref:Alpha-galactosidase n=1 Tax=Delitschia confertaspora ATCC 74209 TaxID=1513339 RepID=A0A9P4MVD0_9PLEO|nr:hypothetical protein GQ43DRAFT_221660 [Delitschia confertaspora ATCC 74209]